VLPEEPQRWLVVLVQAEPGRIWEDILVQEPTVGLAPRVRQPLERPRGGNDKERVAALGPPWVRRDHSLLDTSSRGPPTRDAA
jgi:hypothetical protein